MKLQAFLSERQIKPSEFARQIGVKASTITRLLNGQRGASLDLALRIERHTDGAVAVEDFSSSAPVAVIVAEGVAA